MKLKVGGVYANPTAGPSNPHRVGIYLGMSWCNGRRYPEFLHRDGRRSHHAGPKDRLVLLGVLFEWRDYDFWASLDDGKMWSERSEP